MPQVHHHHPHRLLISFLCSAISRFFPFFSPAPVFHRRLPFLFFFVVHFFLDWDEFFCETASLSLKKRQEDKMSDYQMLNANWSDDEAEEDEDKTPQPTGLVSPEEEPPSFPTSKDSNPVIKEESQPMDSISRRQSLNIKVKEVSGKSFLL